jgi:organic radical activating enzyme
MRGDATQKNMKDEVIEQLNQIDTIGNLTVCGGEPTLALPTLEKILTFIVDNHIGLDTLTMTINGTNYSEELLRLLDYIDEYIPKGKYDVNALIGISRDPFHLKEITERGKREEYIENLARYVNNPHFLNYRDIDKKLFREGRAELLDSQLTVPMRPWPIIYTYLKEHDVIEVGPLISINADGIVTECDASHEHQRTLYNYGNVLEEDLETIIKRVGEEVSPRTWYRKTGKIMKKQANYNK